MDESRRLLGPLTLIAFLILAVGAEAAAGQEAAPSSTPTSGPEDSVSAAAVPTAEAVPSPVPEPPPVYVPPPAPPFAPVQEPPPEDTGYGRAHSMHLGLSLGVGGGAGGTRYAGGLGFGYFVMTGVAPGADISVNGGSGVLTTTALTGTLRLVPVRTDNVSLFLIGRAGRLFISSHSDVWAAGGGAGVIVPFGRSAGLVVSYEILGLWPSSHCSDLANHCRLDSFGLGLIFGF